MSQSPALAAPPSGILRQDTHAIDRLPGQQALWVVGQTLSGAALAALDASIGRGLDVRVIGESLI